MLLRYITLTVDTMALGKSSSSNVTLNSFVGQRSTNSQAKSDLKYSFDTAKFVYLGWGLGQNGAPEGFC